MDFINKYLMPHKGKIAIMLLCFSGAFSNLFFASPFALMGLVLLVLGLLIYVWLGWDSQRRLGWSRKESVLAAVVASIFTQILVQLPFLMQGISNAFLAPTPFCHSCQLNPSSNSECNYCEVDKVFVIVRASMMVGEIIFAGMLAFLGHAAAEYLGGKAAKPQPAKSAGSKRKH